jgi:hypothetical protein
VRVIVYRSSLEDVLLKRFRGSGTRAHLVHSIDRILLDRSAFWDSYESNNGSESESLPWIAELTRDAMMLGRQFNVTKNNLSGY